jgi:Kef-type K+ transport system membrane component KefB
VFAALAACFAVSIASLFVRYRAAHERERAQLRWMMWAVALAVLGLVGGAVLPVGLAWLQPFALLLYALVPVAVAVAVLRYRLYEIDRVISRTAAYAIVTLVVISTYALVVLLISLLIPGRQDHTPPIVVALATLAAAGVFLPALRWVRRLIDRVFNRSQYDAERVVIAFGERIRNGADPHTAGVDLVGAVGTALQPSAIGLWVREEAQ